VLSEQWAPAPAVPEPKIQILQTRPAEAVMADPTSKPGSDDVADGRGRIAPGEMPGDGATSPDEGIDEAATHETAGRASSGRRIGTQGAAIEDLADPDADANFPDPTGPISMSTGPQAQPNRGRDIPGGGYGDSRTDGGGRAISDEEARASTPPTAGIRSGSHVTEDDTKGGPSGAEHSAVSQPANVNRPRQP
jgi:hypothetical protein